MTRLTQKVTSLLGIVGQLKQVRHLVGSATFTFDDLDIRHAKGIELKPKPDPDNLLFGHQFTDHMFEVEWTNDKGWDRPKILPLHDFMIHPAAKVFHYAIEVIDGFKAYRGPDNRVRVFRPGLCIERMRQGAERAMLPDFDGAELVKCIKKLLVIDQEWVPYSKISSLYIRPTFIGTEPSIGMSRSHRGMLYCIAGPVGPYFAKGIKPVSLLADPQYVRAWAGGSGGFKLGSNYGPTIYAHVKANEQHGCQQNLWLYGSDHQCTEMATMNFFVFWINENGEQELMTPPLDSGIILPGVTRRSILELAREWNEFKVVERSFTMNDLVKALKEGRLKEAFGSGTASIVCPVDRIVYEGESLYIPTMDDGAPVFTRCITELTDIQFGRTPNDWAELIDG